MPQGFYRPISLQALQIECENGEIKDKFREILSRSCHTGYFRFAQDEIMK